MVQWLLALAVTCCFYQPYRKVALMPVVSLPVVSALFPPLFLPTLGPLEVVILLVIVLICFGPGKLPEVFSALGNGVKQFKKATTDATDAVNQQLQQSSDDETSSSKSSSDITSGESS